MKFLHPKLRSSLLLPGLLALFTTLSAFGQETTEITTTTVTTNSVPSTPADMSQVLLEAKNQGFTRNQIALLNAYGNWNASASTASQLNLKLQNALGSLVQANRVQTSVSTLTQVNATPAIPPVLIYTVFSNIVILSYYPRSYSGRYGDYSSGISTYNNYGYGSYYGGYNYGITIYNVTWTYAPAIKIKHTPKPLEVVNTVTSTSISSSIALSGVGNLGTSFIPPSTSSQTVTVSQTDTITTQSLQLLKSFLNQASPGIYTALPSILFNSDNIQNTQLQQRLWAVREGTPDNSSLIEGQGDGESSGKNISNTGKSPLTHSNEADQKWLTFADGNGMWSQAQSVNNLPGYKSYAGGVQVGATYQPFKGFQVGPYVGYQGTRVNFGQSSGNSSAIDNSVRYGLFAEYSKGGFYADGIAGGAYNSLTVNHDISVGNAFSSSANGNLSGGEFDSLFGTGYNFKAGHLSFGPMSSLQYTYLNLGSTQETGGGVLNLNVGSQNTDSLLYTLGGQVSSEISLPWQLQLQPFGSLAWQHEFLQDGYTLNYSFLGENIGYQTANAGRDQYIAALGANLVITTNLSAYAVANLINGDAKVFTQSVSGGIQLKF